MFEDIGIDCTLAAQAAGIECDEARQLPDDHVFESEDGTVTFDCAEHRQRCFVFKRGDKGRAMPVALAVCEEYAVPELMKHMAEVVDASFLVGA